MRLGQSATIQGTTVFFSSLYLRGCNSYMKRRGLPRISLGGVLLAFPFSGFSFSQVLTRLNSEGVPVPA